MDSLARKTSEFTESKTECVRAVPDWEKFTAVTGRVCVVSGSHRVNWDTTWELISFTVPDRDKFGNEGQMTDPMCIVSGSQRVNQDSTWELRSFRGR